ncbi:MAG: hypothetical protein H6587_02350 [Flavobacteriales bacterium]|nr:hypothetical protein [Flavobacteriales bacterium]MCB9363387.1 hypothetical protein [Flavobacteriales bacterium]
MNWLLVGLVLIIYPLFGLAIILIKNKLAKTQDFNIIVFTPILISFILGIGFLGYSLALK